MQKLVEEHMKMLSSLNKLTGPYSYKIADVKTGTWRHKRPVVQIEKCVVCGICTEYCPCGVIEKVEKIIQIDYTYCKGCGICAEECPRKAIDFLPEADFAEEAK